MHLDALVNQTLQMIGAELVRFLGSVVGLPIVVSDVRDMFIHGSITDYYWDKCSDIDLCIVLDLAKVRACLGKLNSGPVMRALIRDWKRMFKLSVFGRGVDITFRDVSDSFDDAGCYLKPGAAYSLYRDSWIRPPVRIPYNKLRLMRRMAYKRYRVIMRQCRYILRHKKSAEFVGAYLSGLEQCRVNSIGLSYEQPITSMTMAFKMVRNRGMFRRLRNYAKQARSNTYQLD